MSKRCLWTHGKSVVKPIILYIQNKLAKREMHVLLYKKLTLCWAFPVKSSPDWPGSWSVPSVVSSSHQPTPVKSVPDCSASRDISSGCQLCDLSKSRSCSSNQHYSFSSPQGFDHDFCLGFFLTYFKYLWWSKPSVVIRQNNFRVWFQWAQSVIQKEDPFQKTYIIKDGQVSEK